MWLGLFWGLARAGGVVAWGEAVGEACHTAYSSGRHKPGMRKNPRQHTQKDFKAALEI